MVQKLAQFTDVTSAIVVGGLSSKVCAELWTLETWLKILITCRLSLLLDRYSPSCHCHILK